MYGNSLFLFVLSGLAMASVARGAQAKPLPDDDTLQVARSFAELPNYISLGDTIRVIESDGRSTRGRVFELGQEEIQIEHAGEALMIKEDSTAQIELRYSDSLANGALWGALVGGAWFGVAVLSQGTEGSDISPVVPGAIFVGMSTGIGVGIDALIKSWRGVYVNPELSGGIGVSIHPVVTGETRAVAVTLRF